MVIIKIILIIIVVNNKCAELKRALERLQLITSHDASVLLTSSCSRLHLMHFLQSSPCDCHMTLTSLSDELDDYLIHMTNVNINGLKWSQTTLPVKAGRLGLRRLVKLALSTFLALVSSILKLQSDLVRDCPTLPND